MDIIYTPAHQNVASCLKIFHKDGKMMGSPFYGYDANIMLKVFQNTTPTDMAIDITIEDWRKFY